ncbi:hypothetical protein [Enterococcus termitis]|uniref:Uncharacterized protein n=1 Tax=Enterococcus termitis TaxID=332950 RepID=A0A1E5H124_9ENTE|nr:hypothetical protein [Enterococcus termitis]OEG18697.1 hypothetical protein BCR25_15980 [Enterococcus termitis]OJG97578.1 hypothetical protein RV18_GL000646 [Enterococcus termitis]
MLLFVAVIIVFFVLYAWYNFKYEEKMSKKHFDYYIENEQGKKEIRKALMLRLEQKITESEILESVEKFNKIENPRYVQEISRDYQVLYQEMHYVNGLVRQINTLTSHFEEELKLENDEQSVEVYLNNLDAIIIHLNTINEKEDRYSKVLEMKEVKSKAESLVKELLLVHSKFRTGENL